MDGREIADAIREEARLLKERLEAAYQETGADLQRTADAWSSGQHSLGELRDLDHPYARRHGSPQLDAGEINDQTGTFRGLWIPVEPHWRDGALHVGIYNADPKAGYLEQPDGGPSSTMFPRPVDEAILADVEPRHEQRVAQALNTTL